MSERTKQYKKNEKILAERLMREKPQGVSGLKYVIEEIIFAQNEGLIERKEQGMTGKFAGLMIDDLNQKMSKQDKSRTLMKIITT